jgi:hypothetical protein
MNHLEGSTALQYGRKYRIFEVEFCAPRGLVACPCGIDTVLAYIGWQAEKGTVAASSLEQYLSAISCRHTDFGLVSPVTGSADPAVLVYHRDVKRTLEGLGKAQRLVDPAALIDCKIYLPASVASAALDEVLRLAALFPSASVDDMQAAGHGVISTARDLMFLAFNFADFGRRDSHHNMTVWDIEMLGSGDLFFCFRKDKSGQMKQWLWPRDSSPDLLRAVDWWLRLRRGLGVSTVAMWQLPGDAGSWSSKARVVIFERALEWLGYNPPRGFRWTLHCVRSGAASEANALDMAMSEIRRQGGWAPKSDVPSKTYIDPLCVPSHAGRRFFGWLVASSALASSA